MFFYRYRPFIQIVCMFFFAYCGAAPAADTGPAGFPEQQSSDTIVISNDVSINIVYLEAGRFMMGQTSADRIMLIAQIGDTEFTQTFTNELPRHSVSLDAFWIARYPVTQTQYRAVMGVNPSLFQSDSFDSEDPAENNRPVEMVSWNDAVEFCHRLSQLTGHTFSLPTEAQWEYAARAGIEAVFTFGDDSANLRDYAWYGRNSGDEHWNDDWNMANNIHNNCRTHPVGLKKPNAWGLYDIHGNVWEWCLDWYSSDIYSAADRNNPVGPDTGDFRVMRGGSILSYDRFCRPAYRGRHQPDGFSNTIGFRVVKHVSGTGAGSAGSTENLTLETSDQNDTEDSQPSSIPAERVRPDEDNRTIVTRRSMVETQIARRGIRDERVLDSMRNTQRHLFVPENQVRNAYQDRPLPIGHGQTISQPYIVGLMTELVNPTPSCNVLEIGAGSGYQAAVLAEIVNHVYTIEIVEPLSQWATSRLDLAGYTNVTVKHADGYYGWPEHAPFDAIVVTAAAPHIPPPLIEQLKDGGRMIIPVGTPFRTQQLVLVEKKGEHITTRNILPVQFVPFTRSN